MTLCNCFGFYSFNNILVSLLSILIPCIILNEHSNLASLALCMTWCTRSCTKDPSHEFLISKWFVYSQFMELGNLFETIVHHLLIRVMTILCHWDRVPIMSTLVCMVYTLDMTYTMSHDIRLSGSHDFTKLLHYIVSQPWENIELL